MGPQCGGGFTVFVRREIVADHDSSRFDLGHQDLPDIRCKRLPVHCALDDPGRDQLIMGQACDEGLGSPGTEGSRSIEPGAAFRPPTQPYHVGFYAGFVNEDHAVWGLRDGW